MYVYIQGEKLNKFIALHVEYIFLFDMYYYVIDYIVQQR